MSSSDFCVLDLPLNANKLGIDLKIHCIAGMKGFTRRITNVINRPGLALNGYYDDFGKDRIQVFGKGEMAFLLKLERERKLVSVLNEYLSYPIACCVISLHPESEIPKDFIRLCEENGCPLFLSALTTYELNTNLYRLLYTLFAETEVHHGVFMEVYNIGILISGSSGVGKSEVALELLQRGHHRLIADDVVVLKKINSQTILGTSIDSKQYKFFLEIRGLGIINIAQIFGIGATLEQKKIQLVVDLFNWEEDTARTMDRLGNNEKTEIMGVPIDMVKIPVKAGRNVPIIIETAAMKFRLQQMGYHGREDPYLW